MPRAGRPSFRLQSPGTGRDDQMENPDVANTVSCGQKRPVRTESADEGPVPVDFWLDIASGNLRHEREHSVSIRRPTKARVRESVLPHTTHPTDGDLRDSHNPKC